MKVQTNLNQASFLNENINSHNIERSVLNDTVEFKNIFADAQIITSQGMIQELIHKFERQEKIVMKNPTVNNIFEYKKIVKELLNIAVQNYKCDEVNIYSGNGYQKNLSLINVVDEKLNKVIDDFMTTNKLSLESISTMEDIKGLVLNVFI